MCKLEGIPLPPDLLEQASRSAPDTETRRKRKSKKKAMAEEEGPRKRKKKLIIKNRGISISESHFSDSVVNEPTLPQTHTIETTLSKPPSHDQTIPDISEQTVYVSEHIVPETIPTTSENIISEQPDLVTPSEQPDTIPSEQVISDKQPQSSQQTPPDNLDHAENIISDPLENVISESLPSPPRESSTENIPSRQSSPLSSLVFDDFSKTDFFSDIPSDKPPTPLLNDPPIDNTSQIVLVVAGNLTPLNTLIDLTSDTEQPSLEQPSSESTSSGSSFREEDFLIHRKRPFFPKPYIPSEINLSEPSSSDTKPFASCSQPALPETLSQALSIVKTNPQIKPNVGKLLSGFECDMQTWIASLKESCSERHNPLEAQQLFGQFRKIFNSVASTILDICCKNALDNLFKTIQKRILYLKDMPENETYNVFAERYAAAKAAERSCLDNLEEVIIVEDAEKAAEEEHVSDGVADMDIDGAQKSLDELNEDAEREKISQKEDSLDMEAWMANQEKVTTELQKSNDEIKSWMVKQDATSSKIENLLCQLLAKKS